MKILLKIFVSLIIIYSSIVNAQDLSKYYGTYSGKLSMGKEIDISPNSNYEINDISVKVEQPNKISIYYHLKITGKDDDGKTYALEYKGNNEGIINSDLSYSIKGNITVGLHHWQTKQWVENTSSTTLDGKLSDNFISGNFQSLSENKVRSLGLSFKAEKKSEEGKCDVNISVPPEVKPGGDFYVVINKIGCVSYYTVYYNGKDKPITKWDGKEVDVEVQVECCDHSAFMKKLKVPAYGSDLRPTEIKQITGKPTDPGPKEIAGGITAGLLLVKLLQLLTSGKGPKTVTPPPVPTEPKHPPTQKKPDDKNTVVKKIEDKKSVTDSKDNNRISPDDRKKKLEEMEKKMEKLREEAKNENQSLNSPFGISRDLCKTVPASFNETKESVSRVYDSTHKAFNKFKDFGAELVVNQQERSRFVDNVSNISGKLKDTCVNYYKNLEFLDDAKDLKDYFVEKNKEFYKDFSNDPKKTVVEYVKTGLGIHHYEKAFEIDRPLEQRMAFLGLGMFNTGTSIYSGTSGAQLIKNISSDKSVSLNSIWQVSKLSFSHNSVLFKEELGKKFPEMYKEAKDTVIEEAIIIKAKNAFYDYMGEKEKTTLAYNVNDELELINQML